MIDMVILRGDVLVITDAVRYKAREVRDAVRDLRSRRPDIKGLANRTDNSYVNEWAVHALCYRWGIMRDKARDADLQFNMEPEVRLMYNLLGPVARLLLKLYR